MTNVDQLPYVEAELNYLAPMTERPRYYAYEPQPGEPHSNLTPEPHRMQIHDLRPIAEELDLDIQGFALAEQRSAVRDFWDDDEVRRVYYPEAERFHQGGDRRQPHLHLRPSAAPPGPRPARPLAQRAAPAGEPGACRPHRAVRAAAGARPDGR